MQVQERYETNFQGLTLDQFLDQPQIEGSPAWEFLEGEVFQKPMPSLFHSRLQRNLMNWLNQSSGSDEDWEAIQELRCVLPGGSPVPDIVVVKVDRLGSVDGPLAGAPDWLIEIRSPDQSLLLLQRKILACLEARTMLAWLIDPTQREVWVWQGQSLPRVYSGLDSLPVLPDFAGLTVDRLLTFTQGKG
jgi:Uma2 family endonuclease